MIDLKKPVYGLGDAPLAFNRCLIKAAEEVGFKRSLDEPCVLTLVRGDQVHGVLGVAVDDVARGGDTV